jgi:glucan biosynthesis protein C
MESTTRAAVAGKLGRARAARVVPNGQREAAPRYHEFDAVRGLVMFLVIGLHAALGYLRQDIPGVLWCVKDAPTVPAVDWFCWWAMGVSNPLYFTIAGFFAVLLYDSRGPRGFLANRARRVGLPFAVGVVTVLPACLAVWVFGWLVSGRCNWKQAVHLRFKDPAIRAQQWGSAHLWFLEYLLVMLAAYALARWWLSSRRGGARPAFALALGRVAGAVFGSGWGPFLLAVPTTALLWVSRQKVGIDASMDRYNSFLIDPVKLLHHATFFTAGLGLYACRRELGRFARPAPAYLALSVPVFAGRAWLLGRDFAAPLRGSEAVALAALGALFSWLMVFGLIGTASRLFRRPSRTLSYLADSSYWIYLTHMPVLGLIQGDLYLVAGHAAWKAPVVLAGTLAVGFGSYQGLVRYSAIGTALHGRRARPHSGGR